MLVDACMTGCFFVGLLNCWPGFINELFRRSCLAVQDETELVLGLPSYYCTSIYKARSVNLSLQVSLKEGEQRKPA